MNESKLESRLRLLLAACKVRIAPLKGGTLGHTTMDGGNVAITIAPGFDDDYTLRVLIHELTHKAMPGELAAFGSFEEDILARVIEPRLMFWLVEHPRRHAWWMRQVKAIREAA